MLRRLQTALLPLVLLSPLACSGDAQGRDEHGRIIDSSGGTVVLGIGATPAYRGVSLSSSGSIAGRITSRDSLADSSVAVARNTAICGDSATLREAYQPGGSLANVLVWVEGIQSGKPLPEVRRETLTIERCRFEPRVLAVRSGSTINVLSRDRAVHEATFYREGAADPIAMVHTVDAGQVVPSEKIASVSGIVEIRCAEHPFARGWIAVFEHPYYAVTDSSGGFTIDSLPPGTYTVKVWQERLAKPAEMRVVVASGGTGRLDLSLALK